VQPTSDNAAIGSRRDLDRTIGEIDARLFGNFAEHLGRMIYGGIYEEGSPLADPDGYRKDVMDAVKSPNAECALYIQVPLLVIAQDAGGAVFAAVKNLRLSPWKTIAQANDPNHASYAYYVRNMNPTITAFNLSPTGVTACDGQPLATPCTADADCTSAGGTCANTGFCSGGNNVFPDGDQTICVATGQPQSYYTCGLDGPQIDNPGDPPNVAEQPNVTWYMTGGALGAYAAPMNLSGGSVASRTFTHFTRPPGPFTIYGIVRDNRDGQNWIAQDFQ